MKTAKVNEIKQILEDAYLKGTIEKPYSVLFVSELDDDVRFEIKEWCKGHKSYFAMPGHYYKEDESGKYIKTNDYGFDSSIEGHDVVFQHYECGYHNDIDWKNNEHRAFTELIHKDGLVVDKELKLVIYSVLYPLWSGNTPLFGEEDYLMFDEVINLKMDVNVFKEFFIKDIDKSINALKGTEFYEEALLKKKLGLFVLNDQRFQFIPIEDTGERDPIFGGTKHSGFCPVDFYKCIARFIYDLNIKNFESYAKLNVPEKGKQMIIEILKDFKDK